MLRYIILSTRSCKLKICIKKEKKKIKSFNEKILSSIRKESSKPVDHFENYFQNNNYFFQYIF